MIKVQKKVIVIGGGLSGLTAANEILKKIPDMHVTVLEANDYLGGRTKSIQLRKCIFDLGAQFIGPTQKHVIELAHESKNQLIPVQCKGKKIIEFKKKQSTYTSNIPSNVNIIALLQMQFAIFKINRMAQKVNSLNPKDCQLGYHWDSMTLQSWLDENISFTKVKVMVEAAIRVILGTELSQVSFLYFLWYVKQSKDFQNLINVQNGLQQKKTKLGTQYMSNWLGEQIKKRNGILKLNSPVVNIIQTEDKCIVITKSEEKFEGDYVIIAMPPCNVKTINFSPSLSAERKLICEKSFMGTIIKVIILYKERYWKNKGFTGESLSDCFDSPVMNGFDDTRVNQNGEIQPALIVFIGGALYRYWKNRQDFKQTIIQKLSKYYDQKAMLQPLQIHWHSWEDQKYINGGPVSPFPPGLLTQINNLRAPEGRIHWAGTQMATVSTGFMDGAIESGKRVSQEIIDRIQKNNETKIQALVEKEGFFYTKYVRKNWKFFQWL